MIMTIKNLWARKNTSLKVILSFTIMITILCVFMTYLIALDKESQDIILGYRSGHYYRTVNSKLLSGIEYENLTSIKNINDIVNYGEIQPVHGIYDIGIRVGDESEVRVCYHNGYGQDETPPNATTQDVILHRGYIDFLDGVDKKIITHNDIVEANYRWDAPRLVSEGKDSLGIGSAYDEIIISDLFADEFRINDPLGKIINIEYDGKIYDNIKIVGVMSDRFYELTGNERSAHMIMNTDSELFKARSSKPDMAYYTEVNIVDYLTSKTVANELLTVAGIAEFESGSDYGLAMASTISIVNIVITGVMVTVGLGIVVALLLNVLVNMGFIMVKKSNYYGILRAYGVKRYQLFNMMFLEIFILSMISAVLAYALTYAIVAILDIAMASMLGIGVTFTPLNVGVTFITALLSAAALSSLVALVNYLIIVRKNVVSLLKFSIEN